LQKRLGEVVQAEGMARKEGNGSIRLKARSKSRHAVAAMGIDYFTFMLGVLSRWNWKRRNIAYFFANSSGTATLS
jgi:hypothetical protein